jgi:hypothetical protein
MQATGRDGRTCPPDLPTRPDLFVPWPGNRNRRCNGPSRSIPVVLRVAVKPGHPDFCTGDGGTGPRHPKKRPGTVTPGRAVKRASNRLWCLNSRNFGSVTAEEGSARKSFVPICRGTDRHGSFLRDFPQGCRSPKTAPPMKGARQQPTARTRPQPNSALRPPVPSGSTRACNRVRSAPAPCVPRARSRAINAVTMGAAKDVPLT